jgi:regulator of sirC expression with transglutaminase-like and TPR domain
MAWRAGVPLVGIGLPGHFLTRSSEDSSAYLDAFSGRLLTLEGVGLLFRTISGGSDLDPAWLVPAANPSILRRMLANLRTIFARRLDNSAMLWTLELDVSLPDPPEDTRHARAACLARQLRVRESVAAFEELAAEAAARGDDEGVLRCTRQIRMVRALLH